LEISGSTFLEVSSLPVFTHHREQSRLTCVYEGVEAISNLKDTHLFFMSSAFSDESIDHMPCALFVPTLQERDAMRMVMRKLIIGGLPIPNECFKFAKIIENLLQGSQLGDEQAASKVTLMVLSEFFATGVIENELIYQELALGRIREIK
jgi:hypothetical protein